MATSSPGFGRCRGHVRALRWVALVILGQSFRGTAGSEGKPAGLEDGRTCKGYEKQYSLCEGLAPCDDCSPTDCRFASWAEWYDAGGCVGLCYRHRNIESQNNECGAPCEGPKTESKSCPKPECTDVDQDCVLSDWQPWSACSGPLDQKTRERKVKVFPRFGGKPCNGPVKWTEPCERSEKVNCTVSEWAEWTKCPVSCGGGYRAKLRRVLRHAEHGGKTCDMVLRWTEPCNTQACPSAVDCELSEWSSWQGCELSSSRQAYRTRKVDTPSEDGGHPCNGTMRETKGCPVKEETEENCTLSVWSQWADCDRTCGGGQSFRKRKIEAPQRNGGHCPSAELSQTRTCGEMSCGLHPDKDCFFGEWKDWSECSSDCGQGVRQRDRIVIHEATAGGISCAGATREVTTCAAGGQGCGYTDCKWGGWNAWSACSCTCGGGTKRRQRVIEVSPANGGTLCAPKDKSEISPCNTESCDKCIDGVWMKWSEWSPCSATCGTGFRSRHRDIERQSNTCGKPALGVEDNYEACEQDACEHDVDCHLSEWSEWTGCSCTCFGVKERHRRVQTYAQGNGKACLNKATKQMAPCNPGRTPSGDMEETPASCRSSRSVPCTWNSWSDWTKCTASCGNGQQERVRNIERPAELEGEACSGALHQVRHCNSAPCHHHAVDCTWNDWEDWGACTKCGGQRYRHRHIKTMPNMYGKICNTTAGKEVGDCKSSCEHQYLCTWSEWHSLGECSATCGRASTMRQRQLGLVQESADAEDNVTTLKPDSTCQDFSFSTPSMEGGNAAAVLFSKIGDVYKQGFNWPVDLKVEPAPGSPWLSGRASAGMTSGGLARLTFAGGEKYTLTLTFVKAGTDTPVEVPKFGLTIFDIDSLKGSATYGEQYPERYSFSGFSGYGLGTNRGYNAMAADGKLVLTSKYVGSRVNDPEDAKALTKVQRGQAATIYYEKVASIEVVFDLSYMKVPDTKRDMLFALTCMYPVTASATRQRKDIDTKPYLFRGPKSMTCAGHQIESVECVREDCPVPKVDDCKFGPWHDWAAPTFSQLCERTRSIKSAGDPGGTPCNGPLVETKHCLKTFTKPQECEWSEWDTWSHCSTPSAQRFRARIVSQSAANGGTECQGPTRETGPCSGSVPIARPCRFAPWRSWSDCSASCGGGLQNRKRIIKSRASGGGEACAGELEELQPCGKDACKHVPDRDCKVGTWLEWTQCQDDGQRYRTRTIAQEASGGGSRCTGALREMSPCNMDVDCEVSAWTGWDDCDQECGGGQKHRQRQITRQQRNSGKPCPHELVQTTGCNRKSCGDKDLNCVVDEWAAWGACSVSCGTGQMERTRFVTRLAKEGGKGCQMPLMEIRACPQLAPCDTVDCEWDDWSHWSSCSCDCDGGQRSRDRKIRTMPQLGGKPCEVSAKEEMEPCNTQPCQRGLCTDGAWDAWQAWQPCSSSCEGGITWRIRKMLREANACGTPAVGASRETKSCNLHVKCQGDTDCRFGKWSQWSGCSKQCSGVKRRSRGIAVQGAGNGNFCDGDIRQVYPCHPGPHENAPPVCSVGPPVDCELSDWGDWASCTRECGGGQRQRSRQLLTEPENGGKGCKGVLTTTQGCNTQACTSACILADCKWADWGVWSACDKCGGERKRYRAIVRHPACGGASCEPHLAEEASNCSRRCNDLSFCAWSEWQNWGDCDVTCGNGVKSRVRELGLTDAKMYARLLEAVDRTELERKFQQVRDRTHWVEFRRHQELLVAFTCGLLSLSLGTFLYRRLGRPPANPNSLPAPMNRGFLRRRGSGGYTAVGEVLESPAAPDEPALVFA